MFMVNHEQREIIEFTEKFIELMAELGLHNKRSKTYRLIIDEKTNYGYKARLYLNTGLSWDKLESNIRVIQETLRCMWIMEVKPFQECAYIKIITKSLDESIEYENPKIKPYEIYMGLDFSYKVIKQNVNEYCMFMLAGATRAGKTRLIYQILLSWIISCSEKEVELYLSDCAKNEYINFQYVKHVKYYASEIEQLCEMMKVVRKKLKERIKVISRFREQGLGTNIAEFNKLNKNNKMSYCYILIDEFSVIVPERSDSKEEKELKQYILDTLKLISKTGAGIGMFCFTATQKTTKEEIPSIIKSMSAVRISFRANDSISSEVLVGDNSAMGLANRIAVYSLNGGEKKEYLFSPTLETKTLTKLLEPYLSNKKQSIGNGNVGIIENVKVSPTQYNRNNTKQINNVIPLYQSQEDDYNDY